MTLIRALWLLSLCGLLVVSLLASAARAADKPADFKPGDRVEAGEGSEWLAGVVLSVDKDSGWIEVQLEEVPEHLKDFPPELLKDGLKGKVPPSHVRHAVKKAAIKPATKPAAKPATPPKSGVRTWKDRTGKFNVKATYQGLKDGKVTLETDKGKRVEVPLDKLAEDDAKYVSEQQKTEDGNPFEDITITQPSTPAASAPQDKPEPQPKPAAQAKPIKVKRSGAKVIQPKTFNEWTYKPVVKQTTLNAQLFGKRVNLGEIPASDTFFEKIAGLYVTDDGSQAVVVRKQGKVGDDQYFFQAVDLISQQAGPPTPFPPKTKVFDISTTENLVAYGTKNFGFGTNSTLTVARPDGDQLAVVAKWEPYKNEDWEPDRDVENAWLLPGRQIMTLGSHGKALTVWDIDGLQALWSISIDSATFSKMAFTQDRQLLAIAMSKDIAVIDVAAGAQVGTLPDGPTSNWDAFVFSDDGRRLCGFGNYGIVQWDLTTGKQTHEFSHRSIPGNSLIAYAGEFILAGNRYLYDIDRGVLLWDYTSEAPAVASVRDGRMWAVLAAKDSKQPAMLMTARMPHTQAIQVAKGLGTREELLVARPGDAVAIKIDVDPAIAPADEVRKAIEANLTEGGFKVVDQADLLVTAVCQRKDPQTIKINTGKNHFNPQPEDIVERSITPHASFITMTLRGEKIWESGYLASPGFTIFLNRDESLDQALVRLTSPNINLIKNAKFTGRMTRPGTATRDGAYGASPYARGE